MQKQAGVTRIYFSLENVNFKNLSERDTVTQALLLLGFPTVTEMISYLSHPISGEREILGREVPHLSYFTFPQEKWAKAGSLRRK